MRRLVVRRGDWVDEVVARRAAAGADARVHVSDDVSGLRAARGWRGSRARAERGDRRASAPGRHRASRPARSRPASGDHYQVFTPYYRRWSEAPRRPLVPAPDALRAARRASTPATLPALGRPGRRRPRRPTSMPGGATEAHGPARRVGRARSARLRRPPRRPPRRRHVADRRRTCTSAASRRSRSRARRRDAPGAEPFVRQLCWRDFYHQILAARPDAAWSDYRPRGDRWNDDPDALAAWQEGRTGYPVVDAGMRQLAPEGFMHNRARMIVASFLTKDLYVDWRARRPPLPRPAGRRRHRQQQPQLAVGRGHRHRHQPAPHLQPDGAGHSASTPTASTCGATCPSSPRRPRRRRPRARPPNVRRAYDYPDPIVDHREAIAEYRARL